MKRAIITILLLSFILISIAYADEIYLKNGGVIKEVIVYQVRDGKLFYGGHGWKFGVSNDTVKRIVYEKKVESPIVQTQVAQVEESRIWKEIAEILNDKGRSEDSRPWANAYENLTPRMKEEARLNVIRDYIKHPDNYYVSDGTINMKSGKRLPMLYEE